MLGLHARLERFSHSFPALERATGAAEEHGFSGLGFQTSLNAEICRGRGYDFSKLAEVDLICNPDLGRPISKNRSPDPSRLMPEIFPSLPILSSVAGCSATPAGLRATSKNSVEK